MKNFHKYPKIYRVGHDENKDIFSNPEDEVVIEEKIDGGNFRFYITSDQKIIFGTRTQQITDDDGNDSNVNKMFRKCVDFVRETLEGKDLSEYTEHIFYGENCVKHTINYDWDGMPIFLGFDIQNVKSKKIQPFIRYPYVQKDFEKLGFKFVPVIKVCKVKDLPEINDELVPISRYALQSSEDRKAEGIVIKNYYRNIFAKYVRDKFKEHNAIVFGGNPKYNKVGDTDNEEFIFKYCTNQRIEKIIFKEIENGAKLDMGLMGTIIKQTYLDIIEENWKEILTSNWKLDFKKLRKKIAPRCRAVLGQMMINNTR